jgi:hypothetical protein
MARDYVITYGGFSVGGSTARQIDGEVKRTLDNSFETTVVEFDFITSASSDAAFSTECLACENAFRVPRQDFVFTQAGQTIESLKQSDNTGLDCNPTITKPGDPADTGRSIKYHVRLEFGRPADNITEGTIPKGLRYDTITVSYSPSRQRTVTVDGIFTAYTGTNAYEQYLAQITVYASAALATIDSASGFSGVSWEKILEPKVDQNISDKFCNFTVQFKEILYPQGVTTKDVPELVDPVMLIDVERFSPDSSGDSGFTVNGITAGGFNGGGQSSQGAPGVNSGSTSPTVVMGQVPSNTTTQTVPEKPWIINVSYSVGVDKTITTALVNEYQSVIRPLLISAAQGYASGSSITLIEDKPEYDGYYNRINVSMQFIAYVNNLIEQHVTVGDRTNFGGIATGLWSAGPYDYYQYQGPAFKIRTILEELVAIDTTWSGVAMTMINSLAGPPTGIPQSSLGSNWMVLSREPKGQIIYRGLSYGGSTVIVASYAIETICQYGNFRTANGGGAGQVGGNTATGGGGSGQNAATNNSQSADGSTSPAPVSSASSAPVAPAASSGSGIQVAGAGTVGPGSSWSAN